MDNIYDIELNSCDGEPNMLDKYKGKVTMVINVTTDCGNAPEYGIIQSIYEKYKDEGFEVLAVPTNEYCGEYIVYDEFVSGMNSALDAKNFATENYGVTYEFSELVKSCPGTVDRDLNEELYPGRQEEFPKQLGPNDKPHPLFDTLCKTEDGEDPNGMYGNFEKFLIGRDGKYHCRHHNGSLMPRHDENEYADKFNIPEKNRRTHDYYSDNEKYTDYFSAEFNYRRLCEDIEFLLNQVR